MNDDEKDQETLDANLAKLIREDNLPPVPSDAQKRVMFDALREKQREIAPPAEQLATPVRPILLHPFALGGIAAGLALLAAMLFFPRNEAAPTAVHRPDPAPAMPVIAPVPKEVFQERSFSASTSEAPIR